MYFHVFLSTWVAGTLYLSEMALCKLHSTPLFSDFNLKSAWCICRPLVMRNGCNLVLLSGGSYLDAQLSTQLARVGITRHSQPFFGVKDKLNLLPVCLLVICHVFWFWIILACIHVACNLSLYSRCMYSCLPVCLGIVHAPYSAFSLTSNEGTPPNTLACYNASSYVYFNKNINL